MKSSTYTKELGDKTERLILQATTVLQISGVLAIIYGYLVECLRYGDKASIHRIYDIILKATKKLKILAKEEDIEPWDGN